MNLCLPVDELRELTLKQRPKAMERALAKMGLPYTPRGPGEPPLVLRSDFEAWRAARSAAQAPAARLRRPEPVLQP